ncbi:MAG: efflux RND transporter periplasmic adaptor subunit [Candidatus Promineifilaceae bacterium]|nr:efflux RND transporter periplasmic adaptor subunit [Candidatus Promineifilaceae bacterium]
MQALVGKRAWWLLLFTAVLLAAGCGPRQGPDPAEQEVVTAFIGDLAASATASGRVLPQRMATLSLETAGRVDIVNVEVGDPVAAGDILVQLETADFSFAVATAEQDLAVQEANLIDLQTPPLPEEVAAAEAAVASAQAQLDQLLAGPREEEIAATEANVRAAEAGVWSASEELDQAMEGASASQIATARANVAAAQLELIRAQDANEAFANAATHQAMVEAEETLAIAQAELDALLAGPNSDAVGAARANVAAAAAQRDARQADLDLLLSGPSEAQIASAETSLAQAEAALESLQSGPAEEERRSAEAQVEQARLALADAQASLTAATLRAPFSGVVSAVHVAEGEYASGAAVTLMDMDQLRVVLSVDEVDVGTLDAGQSAELSLETWPDETIPSEVVKIAPAAGDGDDQALVTYDVHLSLEETTLPVRAGMTANARLVTAQRQGVLLVPNRAIIADRQAGQYFVNVITSAEDEQQTTERVEVTIGLRDDQNTQITSGLEAGDRILVGEPQSRSPRGDGDGPPFAED